MKNLTIIIALTIAVLFFGCSNSSVDKSQMVNPLLGDISYEIKFGHKPDATTDNTIRIRTPARRNVKRKLALHSEISCVIKRHSVRELVTTSKVNVSADGMTLDGLRN